MSDRREEGLWRSELLRSRVRGHFETERERRDMPLSFDSFEAGFMHGIANVLFVLAAQIAERRPNFSAKKWRHDERQMRDDKVAEWLIEALFAHVEESAEIALDRKLDEILRDEREE